jgi:hypothetical protein
MAKVNLSSKITCSNSIVSPIYNDYKELFKKFDKDLKTYKKLNTCAIASTFGCKMTESDQNKFDNISKNIETYYIEIELIKDNLNSASLTCSDELLKKRITPIIKAVDDIKSTLEQMEANVILVQSLSDEEDLDENEKSEFKEE